MTARPSRPEIRHSILARLSSFTTEVEWVGTGAHVAFADSIVDLADWLATCNETPPPPRAAAELGGPGHREYQQAREQLANRQKEIH